ncbi:hypothetical protein GOP47_0011512 [Adiantum capillus-veneris]|uniref:Phospholipid/glycerol acyltransferase domain-containing protein n=1 Tax=Adiantum capillus-veneris TaxID=13818 RepID=A0A9D4UTC6_ADICA|nr:hypothetical protein GOP47_0011512 [Adiantum capillus-veneris]
MGLLRRPSLDMSLEDDFRKPLLQKQDRPLLEPTLSAPHSDNSRNGKADVILDIALGEDSDTGLDENGEHVEVPHEETSSFDEDGQIEEDAREISASGESFGRPRTDDLHGLYSFLGEQPTLGPMPTIDPFRNHGENIDSLYEWIKVILCIPLVIVRLLLIILITVGGVIIAKLLLLGWNEKTVPMPRWRRNIVYITRLLARLILFCCGYHWIRRLGRPAKREIAPIVISNHVSFIDPIFFFFELFPCFVSSASHSNLPGIGMIIRPMQVINVERSSADSKKYALKEIKSRAMTNSFPHVMLFPEGTTTNGRALIFFQLGAFMPGLPVQPVILRYPYAHFDNSWGRISILKLVWRMLSQFHNFMEVEYLPVVYPSTREKDHPTLFAKKVKRVMARALNVAATNHSYGDLILSTKVKELKNTSFSSCMVEMAKMEKLFHITTKEAGVFLEKFQALDTEHRGYVTEDQFLDALNLPRTPFAQQIFGFFDKEEEGSISFREFLSGSAFILKHPSFDTLCRASFEFCDVNKQGFLSSIEVERSLRLVFPDITSMQVQKMQKNLDADGDGIIKWDDFRDFLEK